MYTFWHFFIRKDRFSYLLMAALCAFGIFALVMIPKESSPEVQVPIGVITTVLPGAPAADVEALVTNEIERELIGTLDNVKSISSASREGVSSITVEFEANADIDASIDELTTQIDTIAADLPDNAEDPVVSEVDLVDQPIMSVAVSGTFNPEELTQMADALETEIETLAGVSRTTFSGVRDREVSVIVKQTTLQQFSLSLSEVISGIRSANQTVPIGQIEDNGVAYNIAFEGDITDPAEIRNLALTTRGGQPVYVRDVATVVDGLSEPNSLSRLSVGGEPSQQSLSMDVYKQRGGDITALSRAVDERLTQLKEPGALLERATIQTTFNMGEQIQTDLLRLSSSGLQTVLLVIGLLILTIGWREGLVAGTAIPLSFVIGFVGLYLSGNTINFISLFALILAIGILVDSSIVMVEGINRRMKADATIDKRQAAFDTITAFSTPIMAGTLTTVAMFSGLFLVSGVTGEFIASIPFTINFILIASLLVALGFIPLIAAAFLRRRNATRFEALQTAKAKQLETWYRQKLAAILNSPRTQKRFLWGIRLLLVGAIALPIVGIVPVVFFEQSDVDYLFVEVELPEGSVREETDIAVRRIEDILYQERNIASFVTTVGAGSAFAGGGQNEKIGSFFINLREDRERTSSEIVTKLRGELAPLRDLTITVDQPTEGPPTGAALGYRFVGDDLSQLKGIAAQAAEILRDIEGAANVTTSATNNSTEFVLTLDKAKATALGLSPAAVSQTLRSAVFGSDATTLTTLDEEIDVTVKLNLTAQENGNPETTNNTTIETIRNLQLTTPSGDTVLLSSIADVSLRESSSVINHEDGQRVVSVSGDITEAGNVAEINAAFTQRIAEAELLPSTVTLETGGETEESQRAFMEMFGALIVGILLMLAVLVLQFNSFLHARYVLSILPYSLIGILGGLALTQLPLSFPSIMGFIALSGIVVNNSILLIAMMNEDRRDHPTKAITDVVLDSAASRLRPILLTTLTTVLGMLPLTYVSELWSPLAYAIMFGLTFSVVITLVLIPVTYHRKPGAMNV